MNKTVFYQAERVPGSISVFMIGAISRAKMASPGQAEPASFRAVLGRGLGDALKGLPAGGSWPGVHEGGADVHLAGRGADGPQEARRDRLGDARS